MVEARNIRKSYKNLEVLKGIDIRVEKGELVTIVGASGAGKSTLLHIIGTLDHADSGQVFIKGEEVSRLPGQKLADFRNRNIGFVFQFHHLLPEFTALENICIPAMIAGIPKQQAEKKAMEWLGYMKLQERAHHKPGKLSGGEQQRVAVARALVNEPAVIFADEPTGNLDSASANSLHELFFDLKQQYGQTFVIVTHNEELAGRSDRSLHIKDGQILSV